MSEWQQMKWGDLATLQYGKSLRDYRNSNSEFRVYGTNGPIGWNDIPLCKHPGIIIGRKGAYRGVHYSSEPFFVIDTAFYLEPKIPLDMKWAYYQLLTQDINGMDSGSAIPSTSRDSFYLLPCLVPPLQTQRAISSILGALDDKIELNRKTNETLKEMAQSIFKSWFVDLDPVYAKAAGKKPFGMDAETAALFPKEFEDSAMGKIPNGWRVESVGTIIELAYGKALGAKDRLPGLFPVYGSGGITGYHNEKMVEGPGIIVGRKGTVGTVYWENDAFFPIDTVFFVKQKINVPLYWIYENLLQMNIASLGADSAVPGVNRNAICTQKWILPIKGSLDKYWTIVSPLVTTHQIIAEQNKMLISLRDTLLPKLLSGQIQL